MKFAEILRENGQKYTAEYVERFGEKELISTISIPDRFKKNGLQSGIETFYKYCLEQGKKANEIVKVGKNDIL